MDPLGMTSRWIAAERARESERADRLFEDPVAAALAGDGGRSLLARLTGSRGEHRYYAIRTRFFDDALLEEAARGSRQVVLLAAGMDARALRLPWPEGAVVFELERQEILAYKESVLSKLGVTPRARRVLVPVDLRDDWRGALSAAGHDAAKPSAFLVEGLLVYLPDESAVHGLLSAVASIAAPGSALGLDVVGKRFMNSPLLRDFRDVIADAGAPWVYGTDEPEVLLERAGWREVRAIQPGEEGAWPHAWRYPVVPRSSSSLNPGFMVIARR